MNLYSLTNQYAELLAMAEHYDEEAVKETLDSINDAIETKIENTVYVIRELENRIEAIKTEEKRLAEYKGSYNKTIDRLKKMIQENVEVIGKPMKNSSSVKLAINSPMLKSVRVQDNPKSLKVIDPEKVPQSFKVPQPDKVDSKAILKAINEGEKVGGVEVNQTRGVRFS
jgi:cell division septum initiation protein DivIVA